MMRFEIPDETPDLKPPFSDPISPRPTQRPASNSDARKRADNSGKRRSDEPFQASPGDPATQSWGVLVMAALEQAWNEGFRAGKAPGWRPGGDRNPYMGEAS